VTRAAAGLLAALLVAAAPAGASQHDTQVPVLLYHHVAAPPRDTPSRALYVPPRLFARQLAALDRAGYTAVTLGQAWAHWEEVKDLPAKPVILSFDDGFADQYRNAARALRAREWPGVLYLQTARRDAEGGLTKRQVRRMLRDGWELGAHSVTHPDLTTVDAQQLRDEVQGSRDALRQAFPSAPVDFFAYPYGRLDAAVLAAVRAAGFVGATTTRRGAASLDDDGPFTLDRMIVTGNFTPRRLLRAVRATSGRR
jgi:peptidoglycan/xylan/chitin deacetylase (PgdA/CDA1 family)